MNISRCWGVAALLLAACTPDATPFPVVVPTDTLLPPTQSDTVPVVAGTAALLRYGLSAGLDSRLTAAALVEPLASTDNAQLGVRYDVMIACGVLEGWERSPFDHHVSLILSHRHAPLDSPSMREWLVRAINPLALLAELNIPDAVPVALQTTPIDTLRTELANAGFPDGFTLRLFDPDTALGSALLVEQLRAVSVDLHVQHDASPSAADLQLIVWTQPQQRDSAAAQYGDSTVIDLYQLPISYLAVDGLSITFNTNGLPEASR